MDLVYSHVCGLDVHKKSVVACIITPEGKEIRTFSTMTDDLIALKEFIKSKGCTVIAIESTGSYWKPIYNLLELENLKILLVNAKHIKCFLLCTFFYNFFTKNNLSIPFVLR